MTDKYILDENGKPVACDDLLLWAKWFETANRTLERDKVDGVTISTVFLGLDHNFGGGTPVLWETMIFGGKHDGYQNRYATKAGALRGHDEAVALVRGSVRRKKGSALKLAGGK